MKITPVTKNEKLVAFEIEVDLHLIATPNEVFHPVAKAQAADPEVKVYVRGTTGMLQLLGSVIGDVRIDGVTDLGPEYVVLPA